MKAKKLIGLLFLISCFTIYYAKAQNTSNKGTEFWIAYAGHIDAETSKMYLYITSDVNTTAEIKIGGVTISNASILANEVTPIEIDSRAYIGSSDVNETDKAIQVVAEKPVVVYAHIFKSARSGATLVLPLKVLGREYYIAAYTQNKPGNNNPGDAFSEFTIIAVEDNTLVKITPKATDIARNHPADQIFQISLQKGEIYQYQSDTDLSGSHVVSVAGANGTCKPIAVFSGSTWVGFCGNSQASGNGGDNLYQQLYPITAWGKEFITAPFFERPYDVFRVYFSKDNTTLSVNGLPIPTANNNEGEFYEFTSSNANHIIASEPISVVQYQVSQNCDGRNTGQGNGGRYPGDPEMTVLNPVEQTLSKITVYSALKNQTTPATNIVQHFINIIIKDEFKSSFTINGSAPQSRFISIGTTGYSYLQEDVTASSQSNPTHTLMADGGFSAIAYGYGNVESYGYLAGADAKNLYQNIEITDAGTLQPTTDVCAGQTTSLTLVLPYKANSLTWVIDDQPQEPIANPSFTTAVINGVTVYKYAYSQTITYSQPGVHQIKVIAENPNPSGCDANEEIALDFEVFDLPEAKFTVSSIEVCAGIPVTITDQSLPNGKNTTKWYWDFGDGSDPVVLRTGVPFEHIYNTAGDYSITLYIESETGCTSPVTDPITVHVNKLPIAKFKSAVPSCETQQITFTDESDPGEGQIIKWYWDFGDVNSTTANSNVSNDQNPVHTFKIPGTYQVSLIIETDKACKSAIYSFPVVINKLPLVEFATPDVCVSDDFALFDNTSANFDGTTAGLTYSWNFGDPASGALNISGDRTGKHKYNSTGDYVVKLTVTNSNGCSVELEKPFTVNGANPTASFEMIDKNNICSNKEFLVKNKSNVGFGKITKLQWFIDGEKIREDRYPVYDDIYTLNYPAFTTPLNKTVVLSLIAYSGSENGDCKSEMQETITINAAPSITFNEITPVCINSGTIKIEAYESGEVPGSGVFTGPGIRSDGLFNPLTAGAGTHPLTYTFTANNGCSESKSKDITVYPIPVVTVLKDVYIFEGGEAKVTASASGSNLQYKWSPSDGLSTDDVLEPVIAGVADKTYTLTVGSQDGCEVSLMLFVHVLKDIKPTNTITPNDDGINDTWTLKYIDSYPNVTVGVFNRYGESVFFSKGYSVPFDGNYKNQALPVGTYYYIIDPNNGRKRITGTLTILR